ncbi:glycosyltransferase [Pseudoalteromonas sp. APC 3356]|uniref:glycosyltransferase family 2 protein n=1 Tax=unclassified Pseudoalteromonas TaxID=194690 RepID=UPI0002EB0471|nr:MULTISPECIES: glycosyltransferase [unclassified Pseudoalteromonas]MDN3434311.1 glycosyltransferase [Pseudoalteromonas sp. APC 3356]
MFNLKAFREQGLPTQEQIIATWKPEELSKPLVSVICTAFNHENYIEDALKGFLMQKTDFPFEIIIHDDASTDKTAEIINDYVRKYPLIIKPILQKKNQYSINGHLPFMNTVNASTATYLALCEADDFWIDENKIQKQLDLAQKNIDVGILFHPSFQMINEVLDKTINNYFENVKFIDINNVILGGGGFMPTASIFMKREVLIDLPKWFEKAAVGDYYIQCIAAKNGALYMPSISAVYRYASSTSISHKTAASGNVKIISTIKQEVETLNELNTYYKNQYYKEIDNWKSRVVFSKAFVLLGNKDIKSYQKYLKLSVDFCKFNGKLQRLMYFIRFSNTLSYAAQYMIKLRADKTT